MILFVLCEFVVDVFDVGEVEIFLVIGLLVLDNFL